MEGAIFVTGAAIQWLRDGLGVIADAAETGPLAASVPDSGGVYVVPAFTGPRLALVGPVRPRHDRRHHARHRRGRTSPAPSSSRWRSRPPTSSTRSPRASGTPPAEMRVDGGASVMDLLCQFQADLLGVPVRRAAVQETTALGAAFLAGIAEGVWDSPADRERDVAAPTPRSRPRWTPPSATRGLASWHRAVERSRAWAR